MNAMTTGLEAEYAAIYAYGAFTHFLGSSTRDLANVVEEEHRVRRDELLSWFNANDHDEVPTPAATYDVGEVENGDQAVEALIEVEESVATAWRSGLETEDIEQRRQCLQMLQESASVLRRWRVAMGDIPTEPWPGRP